MLFFMSPLQFTEWDCPWRYYEQFRYISYEICLYGSFIHSFIHSLLYFNFFLFCLLQQRAPHSNPLKICTHTIQVLRFRKFNCGYQHFWCTGIIYCVVFVCLTAVERNNLMRLANTIPFTPVSILGNFFVWSPNFWFNNIMNFLPSLSSHFIHHFPLSLQEVKRWASTLWRKCPQTLTLDPTQSPPGHREACLPCCSPSSVKRALWMGVCGRAAGCCVPGQNRMCSDLVWYTWSKPSGLKWFVPGRGTSMVARHCSFV